MTEPFELYEQYKKGSEQAFRSLYDRYCGGLFNYCFRLLGDWHHAEDVLITTFTKLAASDLKDRGNLKAWLYRVATNQCYRIFRKKKEVNFSETQFTEHIEDPGPHILRQIKVQKLLSELSDNHRIVIVLKFYENMNYQEIADVLCCSLGTVKSRMHEAIKNLRRRLNGLQKY